MVESIEKAENITRLRTLFNRSIRLNMGGCRISDWGATAIGHAIEKNKKLAYLSLSDVL